MFRLQPLRNSVAQGIDVAGWKSGWLAMESHKTDNSRQLQYP
jgi:hypothetical protein